LTSFFIPMTAVQLFTESDVSQHYDFLNTCGFLGEGRGYLRVAYSDRETQAMNHFKEWAEARGAVAEWDEVRNLVLTWNPKADRFVEFCSHLDTVPQGGNFDGAAGIISGVLSAERITKEGMLPNDIGARVRIFRGEESGTFGVAYIGSLAAFGQFDPKHLGKVYDAGSFDPVFGAKRLEDAMVSQGVDLSFIKNNKPTISEAIKDTIISSQELHIEQGPVLLDAEKDIGVVTSIRGANRIEIMVHGQAAHSGTTPRDKRKDANLGAAKVMMMLDNYLTRELSGGISGQERDLIITPSMIQGGEGMSLVSRECSLKVDIRGTDPKYLEDVLRTLKNDIPEFLEGDGLTCTISEISRTRPVESLDPLLRAAAIDVSYDISFSYMELPSGAGHDSAVIAQQKRSDGSIIPTGMIFIPNDGESHHPSEYTTHGAIARGASVMALSSAINAEGPI
jgi:hydantoinase/carbamoylase family amidase